MSETPFTPQEQEIMDALVIAANKFTHLQETHPTHKRDFLDGIHRCQDVLIHRIVQRDYPETFPTTPKQLSGWVKS